MANDLFNEDAASDDYDASSIEVLKAMHHRISGFFPSVRGQRNTLFDQAHAPEDERKADEQVEDAKDQPNAGLHPDQLLPDEGDYATKRPYGEGADRDEHSYGAQFFHSAAALLSVQKLQMPAYGAGLDKAQQPAQGRWATR